MNRFAFRMLLALAILAPCFGFDCISDDPDRVIDTSLKICNRTPHAVSIQVNLQSAQYFSLGTVQAGGEVVATSKLTQNQVFNNPTLKLKSIATFPPRTIPGTRRTFQLEDKTIRTGQVNKFFLVLDRGLPTLMDYDPNMPPPITP